MTKTQEAQGVNEYHANRRLALKQLGITVDTQGALSREWQDCLTGCMIEPNGWAAYEFENNLRFLNRAASNLQKISIIEAPKPDKDKSGDVILMANIGLGLFVFVGDGVTPGGETLPEIQPLLKKIGCENCPDALIGLLLKEDGTFFKAVLDEMGAVSDPAIFFSALDHQLRLRYEQELGLSQDTICHALSSQLPSLCGVAAFIENNQIDIATIGDSLAFITDDFKTVSRIATIQNEGVDELTAKKIRSIMELNLGMTVSQVKETEAFHQWLVSTYNIKMNHTGGVAVVNGQFNSDMVVKTKISTNGITHLILTTDGFTLGTENEREEKIQVLNLTKKVGVANLISFLSVLQRQQARGYSENFCVQEKKYDDVAALVLTFAAPPVACEIRALVKPEASREEIFERMLGKFLLPWERAVVDCYKQGMTKDDIVARIATEIDKFKPIGPGRGYSQKVIDRWVDILLTSMTNFNEEQEREIISKIEKKIRTSPRFQKYSPEELGAYTMICYVWRERSRNGWTQEALVQRANEVYGTKLKNASVFNNLSPFLSRPL